MPRIFLPLLILSIIACCLEVEISVPGFPNMADYFKVPDGIIQLTVAYNFLGFCLSALFYGPLSECYGRRKVMIVGNALLLMGAIGCVCAPSINWLLASRFIQGMGASTSAVVIFAMIADIYQGEKAAKLIGMINSVLTILMAIAPVVGGFINEWIGWRGNYGVVALICLISWILLFLLLPETKTDQKVFRIQELVSDYKRLLMSFRFVSASLVPSLLYSAYMAFVACASFLYIETFGLSVLAYAVHQAVIVASFALVSFFSGLVIQKLGARGCVLTGMRISLIGALAMTGMSLLSFHSPYLMTSFMTLFCIGFAIYYPVVFASSLEIFPEMKGTASSAIMSMRAALSFSMIGLVSYLYNGQPLLISLVILFVIAIGTLLSLYLLQFIGKEIREA